MLGLAAGLTSAWAAPRTFPANAKIGTIAATVFPQVTIDGQTKVLAPGGKIYSKQNTIVMHSTLVNTTAVVKYTIDRMGYIDQAWILTDEELAAAKASQ
jgi:hypothetical protein